MKSIKFLDACKGMMYLLIGIGIASFGIASITGNPAKADNPSTVNSTGKIQMAVDGFVLNGKAAFHIIVWDTETGKSKTYTYGANSNKFLQADYQLPSSPLY